MDGPQYVPALVNAMLNSPEVDGSGHSTLFTLQDFTSAQPGATKRPLAKEACEWWAHGESYLKAYGRLSALELLKVISSLQVRSVMFVHNKKCASRKQFVVLGDIAKEMYSDAKAVDQNLPAWSKIDHPQLDAAIGTNGLQEMCHGGQVTDNKMVALGFKVGAMVKRKISDNPDHTVDRTVQLVTCLKQCLTNCTVCPRDGKEEDAFDVPRLELLTTWQLHVDPIVKSWTGSHFASFRPDILSEIYKGTIKGAMVEKFQHSSETHMKIWSKPNVCVRAGKALKEGSLTLVGLTSNVAITCDNKACNNSVDLGTCFEGADKKVYKAYAKSSLVFPRDDQAPLLKARMGGKAAVDPEFQVAYWAVEESFDPDKSNCEIKLVDVVVKPLDIVVKVPLMTNTKPILKDSLLIVLNSSVESESSGEDEPVAKRCKPGQRLLSSDSKASKGKTKDKGCGKAAKGASKGKHTQP